MWFFEASKEIFLYLTDKDIFPTLIVSLVSFLGIKKFSKELRFKSIMSGISEKIERIHKKNEEIEKYCSEQILNFLENIEENDKIELLSDEYIKEKQIIVKNLSSLSIGASRPLETYIFFLKYCLSKNSLFPKNEPSLTKDAIENLIIQSIETIQKQALTIIEAPDKIKLEKKSPIRKELRQYTSSKGFNSTPNVEIGPSASSSTDEALYFYAACLRRYIPFRNPTMFARFFELIRGNLPFCIIMKAEKILAPNILKIETTSIFGEEYNYHAINSQTKRNLSDNSKHLEIIYANISRGIELNLSNQTSETIQKKLSFHGIKTEFKNDEILNLEVVQEKYIKLTFDLEKSQLQFKRNRKELELYLLKEADNLSWLKKIEVYLFNAFRWKY
jgi:hypothetical protein